MNIEPKTLTEVDQKHLFAKSVCLFIVASAENRAELEEQVAIGRDITFVKGKLAMVVMSMHFLDASNMTKVPFPIMLLEPDRHNPRDGIVKSLSLNIIFTST